jgi:hypothetical protein
MSQHSVTAATYRSTSNTQTISKTQKKAAAVPAAFFVEVSSICSTVRPTRDSDHSNTDGVQPPPMRFARLIRTLTVPRRNSNSLDERLTLAATSISNLPP